MPAVWYIGQAAKRTVGVESWEAFGIIDRPAVTWEKENGWSIPHAQLTAPQLALLNNDPLFVVGAPDGPRTGMPAGIDAGDVPTKGWTVEQIVQRLGEYGSVADPEGNTGGGNPAADVPVGGVAGQVLTKNSDLDYDAQWKTPAAGGGGGGGGTVSWPAGGTTGQYLGKNSNSTGDVGWRSLPAAAIGNVMFVNGTSTAARPTDRTDVMVIFATTGTTPPANMVPNLDIWMQRP